MKNEQSLVVLWGGALSCNDALVLNPCMTPESSFDDGFVHNTAIVFAVVYEII